MSIDSAPADNSPEASPSPPTVASLPAPSSRPWRRAGSEDDQAKGEGSLRTFLGTAPGVGKTFAMLAEGRRRAGHGERVVAGWIEWHGRPETRGQLGGLEVIAPRRVDYRGTVFTDFDAGAATASGADVVLVDELAHATADRTRQRWQDVAEVLRAGVDVVTTVNVAHLRSVRDYAARITGAGTVAWVPDEFVRSGEVVLVDLPAEALRARIASGMVYSAGQVGGALADYFRAANLQALSELARAADAPLLVVHVQIADGLAHPAAGDLDRHRELTAELGGTYTEVTGATPAQALADTARAEGAATVVVGHHRSRLGEFAHGSVSSRLRRQLPETAIEEVRKT